MCPSILLYGGVFILFHWFIPVMVGDVKLIQAKLLGSWLGLGFSHVNSQKSFFSGLSPHIALMPSICIVLSSLSG